MLRFKETFAKKPVRDSGGAELGYAVDMGFAFGEARPLVTALAVHLPFTDKIGSYRLIRPVDDVELLLPWSAVASFDDEEVVLSGPRDALEVLSAEGLLLIQQDVIDKQIVDDRGNRLQRVDDVILAAEGAELRIDLLYLGMTWLPSGVHLKEVLQRLTHKARAAEEVDEIPWELVDDVDREADILTLKRLS